jgi:hypothetical protein
MTLISPTHPVSLLALSCQLVNLFGDLPSSSFELVSGLDWRLEIGVLSSSAFLFLHAVAYPRSPITITAIVYNLSRKHWSLQSSWVAVPTIAYFKFRIGKLELD